MKIALGNARPKEEENASWDYVGPPLIKALRGFGHEVRLLTKVDWKSSEELRWCDAIIAVKNHLIIRKLLPVRHKMDKKVVYLPLDNLTFSALGKVDFAQYCRCCDLIVATNPLVQQMCSEHTHSTWIHHPIKYFWSGQDDPARRGNYLFWPGTRLHLQPLVEWHNRNSNMNLVVLTNGDKFNSEEWGFANHQRVDMKPWSPAAHIYHCRHAGAGIDIKPDTLRYRIKPVTKVAELLASGLPVVVNKEHPIFEMDVKSLRIHDHDTITADRHIIQEEFSAFRFATLINEQIEQLTITT